MSVLPVSDDDVAGKRPRRLLPWLLVAAIAIGGAVQVTIGVMGTEPGSAGQWSPPPPPAEAVIGPDGWESRFDELRPARTLPPWLSAFSAVGLGALVPGGLIVGLLLWWARSRVGLWRAKSAADRAKDAKTLDRLGEQIVYGEVTAIDGADEAVLFVVEQDGTYHEGAVDWLESARRTTVHPFTLELASGQRLRVEPDDAARLIDGLDEVEVTGEGQRERRARLTVGQRVYVSGQLTRGVDPGAGYRGGKDRLVLRPPSRGRMLISFGTQHQPFERRARSARTWIIVFAAYLVTLSWFHNFPHWITFLRGDTAPAAVVTQGMRRSQSPNSAVKGEVPFVNARTLEGGYQVTSELYGADARLLVVGSRIPVVFHPRWLPQAQVGQRPTQENVILLVNLFLGGLVVLAFVIARLGEDTPLWARRRADRTQGPLPPWPPEGSESDS
ncbi:MAG: hypothetical protein JRI23_25110 [Deltaproteobacteria bacterium]|jgi:hypothetical protein|nr:hypothetical protein [Deltaproteobacteria bacterium]MBW2535297.1 hypothetical protein [Deltaproteobacteria bacterium]